MYLVTDTWSIACQVLGGIGLSQPFCDVDDDDDDDDDISFTQVFIQNILLYYCGFNLILYFYFLFFFSLTGRAKYALKIC